MTKDERKQERQAEIKARLENGVQEIFSSGKYAEYVTAMSRFHNYSINNRILIAVQCPSATYVAGFNAWNKNNRTVKRGEKGIMIYAPTRHKYKVKEIDAVTGDEVEVEKSFTSFAPTYVYDISQTEGEELPEIANMLNDKLADFEEIKARLIEMSPCPISFEHITNGANGYYSPTSERIVIEESLPEKQMVKTMLHEISHKMLGHGEKGCTFDRETKEVQAESTAFWVSQLLGIDTSEYSFGYIAGWSHDKSLDDLKESLKLIEDTATAIFDKYEATAVKAEPSAA